MKTHHAVSGLEFFNARAHFHDGAGKLVSENLRWGDVAVLNLLDVGPTYTAGGDAEKDFAFADFRDGYGLDDDPALAAIDAGAHMPDGADWPVPYAD